MRIRENGRLFRPNNKCGRWSFFATVVALGVAVVLLLNYFLDYAVRDSPCPAYACNPAIVSYFSLVLLAMAGFAMAALAAFTAHELNLVEDIVWSKVVWDLSEHRWHQLQGAAYLNKLCQRAQRVLHWATIAFSALAILSFAASMVLLGNS